MIRALCAWSWLASATGAALMYIPHAPLLVAQWAVDRIRR